MRKLYPLFLLCLSVAFTSFGPSNYHSLPPTALNCPSSVTIDILVWQATTCGEGSADISYTYAYDNSLTGRQYTTRIRGNDWAPPLDYEDLGGFSWGYSESGLVAGEYTFDLGAIDPATGAVTVCASETFTITDPPDTEAPVISCTGSATIAVGNGFNFVHPPVSDNCTTAPSVEVFHMFPDGTIQQLGSLASLPDPFLVSFDTEGEHRIIYSAIDNAGNVGECTDVITVTPRSSTCPVVGNVFSLDPTGCITNDGYVGVEYTFPQLQDTKEVGVVINGVAVSTTLVDASQPNFLVEIPDATVGGYTIVLEVFDPATNTWITCPDTEVSLSLKPQRDDYFGPVLFCDTEMVMDTLDATGMANVEFILPQVVQDYCGRQVAGADGFLYRPDGTVDALGDLFALPDPFSLGFDQVGVYTLLWRAWDFDGNENSCELNITIKPNQPGLGTAEICNDPTAAVTVADCSASATTVPVTMVGVGNVGRENGLQTVYIDADLDRYFSGIILLESPDGQVIELANSLKGSFANYPGSGTSALSMIFRDCPSLPVNDDPALDASYYGGVAQFQPLQSFDGYNQSGAYADGVWTLLVCNNDPTQDFKIYCVQLEFGPTCPVIDDYTVTPADCNQSTGEIEITAADAGVCNADPLVFSLDGMTWTTSPVFSGLAPGTYYVSVGLAADGGQGTIVGTCVTYTEILVPVQSDIEAPVITGCPADRTLKPGENDRASVRITEPTFSDDCGIRSDTLLVCRPGGDVGGYEPQPGETTNWTLPLGIWEFKWIVTDYSGKSDTCKVIYTVTKGCDPDLTPPVIVGCPLDTTVVMRGDSAVISITEPTASDNCMLASDTIVYTNPSGDVRGTGADLGLTFPWTLREAGEWSLSWIVTDTAGNADTCTMQIRVIDSMELDSCSFNRVPPQVSNCPEDQQLDVSAGEEVEWQIVEPTFTDDCGLRWVQLTIQDPSGVRTSRASVPGDTITMRDHMPGIYGYTWTARDSAGNRTTCRAEVHLVCPEACVAPSWFMAENCGALNQETYTAGSCLGDGEVVLPIEVYGVGNLSPTHGLIEVEVEIRQRTALTGDFWLRSPQGRWIALADAGEGSFPTFTGAGSPLKLHFRPCATLPDTRDSLPLEMLGDTAFLPLGNLQELNDQRILADGRWQVVVCNTDPSQELEVYCAKLHFGALCPEILDFQVTGALCTSGSGSINVLDVDYGVCPSEEVLYFLDSLPPVSTGFFDGLAAGTYTLGVGYRNGDSIKCVSTIEVVVPEAGDQQAPVLMDCPKDFVYSLRYGDSISLSIPFPQYYDDCSIQSATALLLSPYPSDSVYFQPFVSGASNTIQVKRCGTYVMRWTVIDEAGNESICETRIEVTEEIYTQFCADICLDEEEALVAPLCGDCTLDIPIEVIGIGQMSLDYGLYDVQIEGHFLRHFSGNLKLISPDGYEYWLAASAAGSFPTFTGDQGGVPFDVHFRRCLPATQHDDRFIAPGDIPGHTFSTIDNLNLLHTENGDGTWYLRVCNTDATEKITIDCVRLRFGQIRPEVIEYAVENAGCEEGDTLGAMEILTLEEGNCPEYGIYFTIDSGQTWTDERLFPELLPGAYQLVTGYRAINSIAGDVRYFLRDTLEFTIGADGDAAPPQLWDCPKHMRIDLDAGDSWQITEPTFTDDCGIASAILRIVNYQTGEILEERPIRPGETSVWQSDSTLLQDYVWIVTDRAGNTTQCTTYVDAIGSGTQVQPDGAQSQHVESVVANSMNISLVPNITHDRFLVIGDFQDQMARQIRIISATGQLILQQDLGHNTYIRKEMSLAGFPAGMYFVTIQSSEDLQTLRVVKQ